MARNMRSFEQFIKANDSLRELYDDSKQRQKDRIEETLRMIDLAKSHTEQSIVQSETAKQIEILQQQQQQAAYNDYVENKTNSKIGNTWNYQTEDEPKKTKNKVNPNITDL